MIIRALGFLLRSRSNWIFKTDVALQRWGPALLPSIQRVKVAKKMHALQHGIQNKRHIVNTKGTISPLLLIYTVLHHCCSTVVAIHVNGNAHSGGARNGARGDCNQRQDDTVLFLNLHTAQTSLGNGNL